GREVPIGCADATEHRGGMFTMTPDGRFVLGPVPDVPGLWVASGCNGSGFSSSLALGEALAGWITGTSADLTALAPARFGMLTDEALIAGGIWQYEHYYDPTGGGLPWGRHSGQIEGSGISKRSCAASPSLARASGTRSGRSGTCGFTSRRRSPSSSSAPCWGSVPWGGPAWPWPWGWSWSPRCSTP